MKTLFILLVSTFAFAHLSAQSFGTPEIKQASTLIWYGLDFSQAKLIGSEGFTNPYDVKDRFFQSWNQLMIDEADKYNFRKAFRTQVEYDLAIVEERNKQPEVKDLVINSEYYLEKEQIPAIVREYAGDKYPEGVGLVFIVESFNKISSTGHVWVTVFDIASKEVLLTRRYSGEARGFGLRNYWAGSLYKIIQQLEKDYGKWLKEQG